VTGLSQADRAVRLAVYRTFNASATAQISVPVYQGGAEYALIRQSKTGVAPTVFRWWVQRPQSMDR